MTAWFLLLFFVAYSVCVIWAPSTFRFEGSSLIICFSSSYSDSVASVGMCSCGNYFSAVWVVS